MSTIVSRSLLNDIALSTALDPSLSSVCFTRPYAMDVVANQVLYVVSLAVTIKSADILPNKSSLLSIKRIRGAGAATPSQLSVCIIGGGSVGSRIVQCLLDTEALHPTSLCVVTRQPDLLSHFSARGVRCFPQNETKPIIEADLIVLACQPGQISAVAKQLSKKLRKTSILVSVCCGVTAEKLQHEFDHSLCLTTFVDVRGLASVVGMWGAENDRLLQEARCSALEAMDAPSFLKKLETAGEDDAMPLENQAPNTVHVSPETDVNRLVPASIQRNRTKTLLELSYPRVMPGSCALYVERLAWCLFEFMRSVHASRVTEGEAILMTWGLIVAPAFRGRILEILRVPEAQRELRQIISTSNAGSSFHTSSGIVAMPTFCFAEWFASTVMQCSTAELIDSCGQQFCSLLS